MSSVFDFDDNDFIIKTGDNTGMDFDGNIMLRMGDNFAMDIDSGDVHYVSDWDDDDIKLNLK